jgi:hypothetical protein
MNIMIKSTQKFCLIILGILGTSCQLIAPYISTYYGTNDYLPLAVGNTWEYTYIEERTENIAFRSPVKTTISKQFLFSVVSVRRLDTIDEFVINSTTPQGKNKLFETIVIGRTASAYLYIRKPENIIFPLPYARSDSRDTSYRGYFAPGDKIYMFVKKIGWVNAAWYGYSGTRGNNLSVQGRITLQKYKVKE